MITLMATLHSLLSWANRQYQLETPELQHAVSQTDEGGSPAMKPAAASYLGLLAKRALSVARDDEPDDWKRQAMAWVGAALVVRYVVPRRVAA